MFTIKILGMGDVKTQALRENLAAALSQYPVKGKEVEVSELNRLAVSGGTGTPGLLCANTIICEGKVPKGGSVHKLTDNRKQ